MLLYIIEAKNRLALSILSFIFTTIILCVYKEILLFSIVHPILKLDSIFLYYFIFTDVTEPFLVYLKLILFISKQVFFIYCIYHLFLFITPALYQSEFKSVAFLIIIEVNLWGVSVFIANSFLIPWMWEVFLGVFDFDSGKLFNIQFEARLFEYLTFYICFYWICCFYFQFAGLVVFVLNLPSTSSLYIKKYRKLFYFISVIIAALTCPDALSLMLFSFFLICIYELGIILKLKNLIRQPIKT